MQARELRLVELASLERAGRLGCAFGVGTAARLARISEIGHVGSTIRFRDHGRCEHLWRALKQVQEGLTPQHPEWRMPIDTA